MNHSQHESMWQFRAKWLFLPAGIVMTILVVCFPKFHTGDFFYVEIDRVEVADDGSVAIHYHGKMSNDTSLILTQAPTGNCSRSSVSGVIPWAHDVQGVWLLDQDALEIERVIVGEGKGYRITPSSSLLLYQFDQDGVEQKGVVAVQPSLH